MRHIVNFPRRFEIAGKIAGNPVRKLAFADEERTVAITAFQQRRTSGFLATDNRNRTTFLCAKPTTAAIDCDEILQVQASEDLEDALNVIGDGNAHWLRPRPNVSARIDIGVLENSCQEIVNSWSKKFEFREEIQTKDDYEAGLRRPQIGAVHAALAHWTVSQEPATIVMPTGTGKTETMLALLVSSQIRRLLVVVPTAALRDQISEKFLTLGILKQCRCLAPEAGLPIVASLNRRPQSADEVDQVFRRSNVIVSTMQVVGQCAPKVQARMAELCTHLFIDEAHHIAAKTWTDFKKVFANKPVLQFTATPFRTDGKRVDGRFIYTYPLAKAQTEGYFTNINFAAVTEYDPEQVDVSIARKAGDILTADLENGFDHVLMARAASIERAGVVHSIYENLFPEFAPVLVHNKTSKREREESLKRLRTGQSRIVVCVDMFGEGFDFPALKVAGLHDRHKSLAIALQFIGRFTRTKHDLGDASFVANVANEEVSNTLRNLYAEDADWNFLVRILSQGATDRARKRAEIIEGFTSTLPDIPLQTLFPRMSAVVYKTSCEQWQPLAIEDIIPGTELYAGPVINPEQNLAIFVTREEDGVRWGAVKQIQNVEWNLYLLHWNADLGLLFINSSNKDFHEQIAETVGGSKERISGEVIFRILGGIKRLTLANLGLSHAFGKNIRYTMFMGADIAEGLSEASRFNKRKSNLFGMGYENDQKVTAGCSFKGRIWSHKVAFDLSEWVEWCEHVGNKLLDDSISTDAVLSNVIKARRISERPPLVPIMVSWPEDFQNNPEEMIDIEIGTTTTPFFECDIKIDSASADGPLTFTVATDSDQATFVIAISEEGATFQQVRGATACASVKNKRQTLVEWFNEDPPIIHFATGEFLVFNELFEPPESGARSAFDLRRISVWDWTDVDLTTESQGDDKDASSIQRRVIDRILANEFGEFVVVFDDDGTGEAADIVAIRQEDSKLIVSLFHCKFSGSSTAGARVDDVYEVCGQAQKCVRWRENPRKLLKHLMHRETLRQSQGRPSRLERGTRQDIQKFVNVAREMVFEFRVYIVQPGLSKSGVTGAQRDVLGATATFLQETYSMPLEVIASA